jgi:hypothetical protein
LLHCYLAKVGFTSLFGARSCSTHPELLSQYIIDQYLFESLLHCYLAKVSIAATPQQGPRVGYSFFGTANVNMFIRFSKYLPRFLRAKTQ